MPTYRNDGDVTYRVKDSNGRMVDVAPGKSVLTLKILSSPFTKTADSPYFPLMKVYESAFTSPGTKTGLIDCKKIKLTTSATGITVKANAATNTYTMPLLANSATEIDNDGEIDSLIFAGTGNVKIEGN